MPGTVLSAFPGFLLQASQQSPSGYAHISPTLQIRKLWLSEVKPPETSSCLCGSRSLLCARTDEVRVACVGPRLDIWVPANALPPACPQASHFLPLSLSFFTSEARCCRHKCLWGPGRWMKQIGRLFPGSVSLGHPGASPPLPQELGFLGLLIFQEKPDFGFFFFFKVKILSYSLLSF